MAENPNPTCLCDPDPWSIMNKARTQRGPIVAGWLMRAIAFLATARLWARTANAAARHRQV